ncbi:MAG: dephospho-CoA kinase [Ignavibacteria bacterium RBG_16_34_14]|nr:MAG: dephospho-CoA kinase [Ignavibacteria bacterium RBG_16_34_14]
MSLKSNKLKIAITGNIGSGKSAFCNFISEKGYPVIKADDLSKDILKNDKEVKEKVIKEFGKESFIIDEINKKFLAEKVFSIPVNVIKINSILHPKVKKKIGTLTKEYFKEHNIVFTEAALIYEAEMESMFDYVVLISADYEVRKMRSTEKGKLSQEDFRKRNKNQIKDEEKKKQADFVFENNGSIKELKEKVNLLITILIGLDSSARASSSRE